MLFAGLFFGIIFGIVTVVFAKYLKGKVNIELPKRIYSYGVTIGCNMAGRTFVIDYTSKSGHFISATTSQHVSKIKREAGVKVISAEEYHEGFHHLVRDL